MTHQERWLPQASIWSRLLAFALLIVYVTLLYAVFFGFRSQPHEDIGIWIAIIGMPLGTGIAFQCLIDPSLKRSVEWNWVWSLVVITVFALILIAMDHETFICVIMAAFFIIPLQLIGIAITRSVIRFAWKQIGPGRLNATLLVLPLVLGVSDLAPDMPRKTYQVVSEIEIDAPPVSVWTNTLEIRDIKPSEHIFTITHDLLRSPRPLEAIYRNGIRHARWTEGVEFQEHVTELVPFKRVSWDFVFHKPITFQSVDTHISPDSEISRILSGGYELHPLTDNRTRLILHTEYAVKGPVNWYMRLWGQRFIGDFHTAVLHVIKLRSEAEARYISSIPTYKEEPL